jgi:hypothetical protein
MTIIHSADFAREGGKLSGAVAIAGLDRLHDRLAKRACEAKWSLVGGVDKLERPFLRSNGIGFTLVPPARKRASILFLIQYSMSPRENPPK